MDGKLETKKVIGSELCYDTYSKELTTKNSIINLSKYERALIELLIKIIMNFQSTPIQMSGLRLC